MGLIKFSLRTVFFLWCLVCTSQFNPFEPNNDDEPETVDHLNLESFSGRWFQMYASQIPRNTFEYDMQCLVANIEIERNDREKGEVKLNLPNGPIREETGTAVNNQFSESPGEFYLEMDILKQSFWIIDLGSITDSNGVYPWTIVSDDIKGTLFILARDVDEFRSKYERDVLQKVREKGFIWPTNSPIKTYQDSEKCQYKSA